MVTTLDYLCTISSFAVRAKRCVENLCAKAAEDCSAKLSQSVSITVEHNEWIFFNIEEHWVNIAFLIIGVCKVRAIYSSEDLLSNWTEAQKSE